MKYILLISFFCCNFSNAISIKILNEPERHLNISSFSSFSIRDFKKNILPKFYPNLNMENLVAFRGSTQLSDNDLARMDVTLVEKVKIPIIDDYIKLLADLLDDNVTILEKKIIEKIHNIKNIKDEKIKLIELIMGQPKEFKDLLYKLISKLIKEPNTISEWSIYKELSSGDKKTIFESLINIIIQLK